jgi:hypothetical protein
LLEVTRKTDADIDSYVKFLEMRAHRSFGLMEAFIDAVDNEDFKF